MSTPGQPPVDLRIGPFRQRVVALEAENARLQKELEDVQRSTTDVSFAGLVGSLAAAAAVAGRRPAEAVAALSTAVEELVALASAVAGRGAGAADVPALTAALDATTSAASALL